VGWVGPELNVYKTDITYKPYFLQTLLRKTYIFPRSWTNLQTLFSKKTLRRFSKKSWNLFQTFKPHIRMYNIFMTRNYFSRRGGPYFVSDGFSQHTDHNYDCHTSVSLISRIKSFFKSRFKSRPSDQK
jgi:hypothetical protein